MKVQSNADAVKDIVSQCDVVVQNLAPGAAQKLGLDAASLRAKHPELIYLEISGYGKGPRARHKAYDLLVCAEAGLCSITGGPESKDGGRVGVSICDIVTGFNAYSMILRAIIKRSTTGKGSSLAVNLFDSISETMAVPYIAARYGGAAPRRSGLKHPSICPYGVFATKNGKKILLAIQNEREWKGLCERVLKNADLIDAYPSTSSRVADRPVVDAAVQEAIGQMSPSEAVEALSDAGVAWGNLNDVAPDMLEHAFLRTASISTPSGTIEIPESAVGAMTRAPVPEVGEHTEALCEEFGVSVD